MCAAQPIHSLPQHGSRLCRRRGVVSDGDMRACMPSYSQAYHRHRGSTARAKSASPRASSKFAVCASASSAPAQNEGSWHSSAGRAICMGPSIGTGTGPRAVPAAQAHLVACDAEARREPSRRLCSFSRKSKDFLCEMLICRCNTSTGGACAVRKMHPERPQVTPGTLAAFAARGLARVVVLPAW